MNARRMLADPSGVRCTTARPVGPGSAGSSVSAPASSSARSMTISTPPAITARPPPRPGRSRSGP